MKSSKLDDAILFAAEKHTGQKRKISGVPFIVHPVRVAAQLLRWNCAEDLAVAGILHDVLEDTDTTIHELQKQFGDYISSIVKSVSEPDKSNRWEDRKQALLDNIREAGEAVLWVACADKLDNLRSMQADLETYGNQVWEQLGRSKNKQQWFYAQAGAIFEDRLHGHEAVITYHKMVDSVFDE